MSRVMRDSMGPASLFSGTNDVTRRRVRFATFAWLPVGAALGMSLLGISAISLTRPELAARQGIFLFVGILEQDWWHGQHVPDVVKTIPHIVLREVVGRLEIDPEQVANRVVVFHPIQSPQSHTSGVRTGGIDRKECSLNPTDQMGSHLRIGLGLLLLGRHFSGTHRLDDTFPSSPIAQDRHQIGVCVEIHTALGLTVSVAIPAVFSKNRQHGLVELGFSHSAIHSGTWRDWGLGRIESH